jgi:hypothetical protein
MKKNCLYIKSWIKFPTKNIIPWVQRLKIKNKILFQYDSYLFTFIDFETIHNIKWMIMLLMLLQICIKLNQCYDLYHTMEQQFRSFPWVASKYKLFYMWKNDCPNVLMLTLWDLTEMPLYKDFHGYGVFQWIFALFQMKGKIGIKKKI